MILAVFFLKNKLAQVWFFEETWLLADIGIKKIIEMHFLSLSHANIWFDEVKGLTLKNYNIIPALRITENVELINKAKFARTSLDQTSEISIVSMAVLQATTIYLSRETQISALKAKKSHNNV